VHTVEWLFWLSLAGVAYIYVGYPLAVWTLSRLRGRSFPRGEWTGPLSIVLAAYNEARRLPAKLDNLLASDAADRICEVLIGSDGSDDDTPEVVASYPDRRVRLISFAERRGKAAVLNALVPQCQSDVVVLTDARQLLDPAALSRLTDSFADPRVGVVSGELMFRTSESDTTAAQGLGAYWSYEKFLRKSESRFRGVPGATGALYAMRRELFRPIPEDTLLDDVVIPMQAVEQGSWCLLEPGAIAWDVPSQSTAQESIRKRRTIAGAAQLIVRQPRWLLPWRNPLWWEYVSHKLARLASPLLLVVMLATNALLLAGEAGLPPVVYGTLLAAQGILYLAALTGWGLGRLGRRAPLLGTALMFVALNLTTVLALWDACRGRFRAAWQRAA
jgi:biofilm PGA synthesis N-glycosyltransferase PgaC